MHLATVKMKMAIFEDVFEHCNSRTK